jgi:hypothetical protein
MNGCRASGAVQFDARVKISRAVLPKSASRDATLAREVRSHTEFPHQHAPESLPPQSPTVIVYLPLLGISECVNEWMRRPNHYKQEKSVYLQCHSVYWTYFYIAGQFNSANLSIYYFKCFINTVSSRNVPTHGIRYLLWYKFKKKTLICRGGHWIFSYENPILEFPTSDCDIGIIYTHLLTWVSFGLITCTKNLIQGCLMKQGYIYQIFIKLSLFTHR